MKLKQKGKKKLDRVKWKKVLDTVKLKKRWKKLDRMNCEEKNLKRSEENQKNQERIKK